MPLKDHVIADSDLHVMEPPDLWQRYIAPEYAARRADRPHRAHPRHAGAGEEPHAAAPRRGAAAAHRRPQDRAGGTSTSPSTPTPRPTGWDAASTVAGHGRRGPRPRGDVPVPRPVRARPRLRRAHRHRRPRAGLRHRHRPGLQRLAGRLLQGGARPHVRRRHGGAARRRRRRARGPRAASRSSGFKAVFLAPGCVNNRPWHHPAYDPLWAEIQRLDVPLSLPRRRADLPHARLLARRCSTS